MKVSNNVLAVLAELSYDGNLVRIEQQLERPLYEQVNKVLMAAGGKWNRGKKAHIFGSDARDALEQVILTGEVMVPQDFGYFPTPGPVVDMLLEFAQPEEGMEVLEPSAGQGNIAQPLVLQGCRVDVIELLPKNIKVLESQKGYRAIISGDFLSITPNPEVPPIYDRVVMNPPFEKRADIHHVNHALKFLKPGGRLVSVMSAGILFRTDKLTTAFNKMVLESGGMIEELPDEAFKASGTSVRTCIVVVDK